MGRGHNGGLATAGLKLDNVKKGKQKKRDEEAQEALLGYVSEGSDDEPLTLEPGAAWDGELSPSASRAPSPAVASRTHSPVTSREQSPLREPSPLRERSFGANKSQCGDHQPKSLPKRSSPAQMQSAPPATISQTVNETGESASCLPRPKANITTSWAKIAASRVAVPLIPPALPLRSRATNDINGTLSERVGSLSLSTGGKELQPAQRTSTAVVEPVADKAARDAPSKSHVASPRHEDIHAAKPSRIDPSDTAPPIVASREELLEILPHPNTPHYRSRNALWCREQAGRLRSDMLAHITDAQHVYMDLALELIKEHNASVAATSPASVAPNKGTPEVRSPTPEASGVFEARKVPSQYDRPNPAKAPSSTLNRRNTPHSSTNRRQPLPAPVPRTFDKFI